MTSSLAQSRFQSALESTIGFTGASRPWRKAQERLLLQALQEGADPNQELPARRAADFPAGFRWVDAWLLQMEERPPSLEVLEALNAQGFDWSRIPTTVITTQLQAHHWDAALWLLQHQVPLAPTSNVVGLMMGPGDHDNHPRDYPPLTVLAPLWETLRAHPGFPAMLEAQTQVSADRSEPSGWWGWFALMRPLHGHAAFFNAPALDPSFQPRRAFWAQALTSLGVNPNVYSLGQLRLPVLQDEDPELLLQAGAEWKSVEAEALRQAVAWFGSTRTLQVFLAHGANPNLQAPDGFTPLHWALQQNDSIHDDDVRFREEHVELLLRAGASLSLTTAEGLLPWQCDAENGQVTPAAEETLRTLVMEMDARISAERLGAHLESQLADQALEPRRKSRL